MFKHILVPVDGGELSNSAVTRACSFAKEIGARLTFYHAKSAYFPTAIAGEALFDEMAAYDAFRATMNQRANMILSGASQAAAAVGVAAATLSSECDSPHEGIIAAAASEACDLIFMASHGRRGASALLLGSETQKVLTHCKTPVLVYRQPG